MFEGTQLLVNCKGVQWYLTYDIESRIAEIKNLSTNESYDFFVDNYYYDDATNKIVDEVYYIGNTSDISKNFYADSFNLDTSDYVRIDLFESDSAIQPMTVITGWRIAQELLEALMQLDWQQLLLAQLMLLPPKHWNIWTKKTMIIGELGEAVEVSGSVPEFLLLQL